jgi:branched-chain amino acid transport system permease protein
VVLPLVGLATAGLLLLRRRGVRAPIPPAAHPPLAAATLLVAAPMLVLSEANVYKLGLVLIVLVAAIGLHALVTWAGELSLAQAPIVGLPAFAVAKLSADHDLSPVYLLPLAIVVGVATGALVGLPALRARGLQVALVTLAAGVAIDRFFFTREWVVGPPGGAAVTTPSIGPIELASAKALWPVLAIAVLLAVTAAWMIDRSTIGRALRWVKAHPDGAASFGIPVSRVRLHAYALAGAFAGLAGGLTAMWVQRMTPQAFPLSLSFTYLIIVALAGRGFVGGVAAAAVAVEGGRLFLAGGGALIAYAAPLGLILTLTRHQSGLNGLGRRAAELIKERTMQHRIRIPSVVGGALVAVGFAAIALAWYHAGNTDQVWVQNQELISGGIGGLALVVLGSALLVVDWLATVLATRTEP